jgi:cbb3-type cytochrome oxidase maturation protein
MSVLIILIVASILVALLFLIGFIWAVKSGQYDDTYSPSVRMLFEDKEKEDRHPQKKEAAKNKSDEKSGETTSL